MDKLIEQIEADIDIILKNRLTDIALSSNTIAVKTLMEIQEVVKRGNIVDGDKSDFDIVEDIVGILERYNISTGGCHDF